MNEPDSPSPSAPHVPVMATPLLDVLRPARGEIFVDATVGAGGHAALLLERLGSEGLLIGIDRDPDALALASASLEATGNPFRLVRGRFSELRRHLRDLGPPVESGVDGVLLDLGVSSMQLDRPERGFSFLRDGPLDMRMDAETGERAAELLRTIELADLTRLLRELGEEPRAARVARAIVAARQAGDLESTGDLRDAVESVVSRQPGKVHPATRTFQAIRIAVNRELDELRAALADLDRVVRPGGRVAVLSYHSLEDRIVKRWLAGAESDGFFIAQRPLIRRPDDEEISRNPRARSARLRAAVRA